MTMADLELRNLSKTFRKQTILRDISLCVPDGSFTILLGPSGCGKSTLLRIIAGLEPQTSGQVLIGGVAVDHLEPAARDIAMVFQQYALYPHLTVRENLAFALTIRRLPRPDIEARIAEAAQLLDIQSLLNRKPKDLSGGQRQRVAMGRAIVRKPKLFLFDEPLSNLDAQLRTTMRIELKSLQQRLRATMIYVTHDQVEAMTLGDRIVLLEGGRIRQEAAPDDLYRAPADPFVAAFIGTPGMNLWSGQVTTRGDRLQFQNGDLTLPIPFLMEQQPSLNSITLGIRPEDILLTPQPGALPVEVAVELIENLGAELLIHCRVGDSRFVVRSVRGGPVQQNHSLTIYLPQDKLHLFVDDRRLDASTALPS
ncbi:MAG: sn-glycerol-3-phosphate import ATP-binding protein UgpC [Nitrospirae bacterium]|nr:MAG: putative sugar ABC transporter ATPase [Nitrospira sp. OLB3]MBV6470687.1 sn-glycerol-3-phosphate import ATP-binding protein UgpC [Nitrospirota bacterium]